MKRSSLSTHQSSEVINMSNSNIVPVLSFESDEIRFKTIKGETFEYFNGISTFPCYGYVYLLRCEQYYKIGIAKDVVKRTIGSQTGNPFEVKIIDTFLSLDKNADEKILHRLMSEYWHRGEWFEIPKTMIGKKSNWFKSYSLPSDVVKGIVRNNNYNQFSEKYEDRGEHGFFYEMSKRRYETMRQKCLLAERLLANIKLNSAFQSTGLVTQGWQYGVLTNATYEGLLGADAKTLKVEMGLKPKESLRDNLDDECLIAIQLSEMVAARKAAGASTFDQLRSITFQQAQKVRDAIS